MKIRYIALHINNESQIDTKFALKFNLRYRFISNFLSREIRKYNLESSDSFNMISIVSSLDKVKIKDNLSNSVLQAYVPLDIDYYENNKGIIRYEYALNLLEEGYYLCNEFKKIPLHELIMLHNDFRKKGYKNEWLYKKNKSKEHNIEVILKCIFNEEEFKLEMNVKDLTTKSDLATGFVLRTLPDELFFSKLFKNVLINEREIIITEFHDRPKFKFVMEDIKKGVFECSVFNNGLEYDNDFISIDDFVNKLR
ncbi:hypothetical protein [Sphingobacterium sp. LRF_L2]|uniref:hypothetical protein n=1 Tax=Sphingobacterium sp. LRF_L2 TaxID=3369421 RepID=UPI003F5DB9B9